MGTDRELRAALERAQAEVKALGKALESARQERGQLKLAEAFAHLERSTNERLAASEEQLTSLRTRERQLRDQVDAHKQEIDRLERAQAIERKARAKLERENERLRGKLGQRPRPSLRALLAPPRLTLLERELAQCKAEVSRLSGLLARERGFSASKKRAR